MQKSLHHSTVPRCSTKLDLRRSYLPVPLAKQSRHLTALLTHEGMVQCRRMPYGLSSAPSAFQKIVSLVLSGIEGTLNLLDDIIIDEKDKAEHDQRLDEVFSQLVKRNLTLNEGKCTFAASEIDFLEISCDSHRGVPDAGQHRSS